MTAQEMRDQHTGKTGYTLEDVYERLQQMAGKVPGNSWIADAPLQKGVKEKLALNGYKVTENDRGQSVIDWSE